MKTRFCPSPTGNLHLGNLRTALFNALLATGKKGTFLLRIEDTDLARSAQEYTESLQQDLKWLGLEWHEGPHVGGEHGPYWQSQRQDIYSQYYQQLEQQNLAYPCFCTEQQLAISRKVQLTAGKAPRYNGVCQHLTPEQIAEKRQQGLQPTLRFRVPAGLTITFTDLVRGEQSFQSDDLGDFIIRRADGGSAFLFCNAVDDALMGVTHALRGEDHIANTPRQLLILQALNLPAPHYGHLALIVGPDGSPLSKRHGSRSIKELRAAGFLPGAIINYLARLGHHYAEHHFMDLPTLANHFDCANLGSAPARFDADQLKHWQREAVAHLPEDDVWDWLGSIVHTLVPAHHKALFIKTVHPNVLFPEDGLLLAQICFADTLNYDAQALAVIAQTPANFFQFAAEVIDAVDTDYPQIVAGIQQRLDVKGKGLYQPLRAALTGELHGPEMVYLVQLIGKERLQQRLQAAQSQALI